MTDFNIGEWFKKEVEAIVNTDIPYTKLTQLVWLAILCDVCEIDKYIVISLISDLGITTAQAEKTYDVMQTLVIFKDLIKKEMAKQMIMKGLDILGE